MKKIISILIAIALLVHPSAQAQSRPRADAPAGAPKSLDTGSGDYAKDMGVLLDAERQALDQARQLLEDNPKPAEKAALETVIKEMERSQAALSEARNSPDKLPAALAAEQAAYQAALKTVPREFRMSRSRNQNQRGSGSGQPNQQELDQLDTKEPENRYETERQATPTPNAQQREQSETLDRLKQLARRQQDLNDRLRDLQTALQEARTDQEREDIQRQLKRLRDEERQMLADVDELRQKMEQSPDASRQAETRQQLEQTRTDVQRAAEQLEKQSVSEALASGARAEQSLQNVRENMRQQSSSQFANQMRQMRNQARDLSEKEKQIAHDLDALNNSAQKTLDDSAQRQSLVDQMNHQQTALTNLLTEMRNVVEQSEPTEPLLSKQLYDVIRREDQKRTDNQLEIAAELVDRGFLPQASQKEHAASENINELRQGVDRAADSVLGSEADSLRYAQKELDDLAKQIAQEMSGGTNSTNASVGAMIRGQRSTNSLAAGGERVGHSGGNGPSETNGITRSSSTSGNGKGQSPENANTPGEASQPGRSNQPSNRQASAGNNPGQPSQNEPSQNATAGENNSPGEGQPSGQPGQSAAGSERERLRQLAQQLGGNRGGVGANGPITGNNYLDWSDRLRDVEQVVDSPDLRNQLATVRERVGVYRRAFRDERILPERDNLRKQVLEPLALARDWVAQELSRAQNDQSLVPLDRDPVQEKYSDLVRQYYEKLGSPQ